MSAVLVTLCYLLPYAELAVHNLSGCANIRVLYSTVMFCSVQ